ncbi:glycosyltransferase [Cohaesibacter celericrescens]|uniref:glycosyltransferase n=1 Tax=Cohaesibacter celericrescens TaxID=2067669 RepID=UPI003563BC65
MVFGTAKKNGGVLKVAAPWSLSHYIPLNGFHPLYRALFDHAPAEVDIQAWDNVQLQRFLELNKDKREKIACDVKRLEKAANSAPPGFIPKTYYEFFTPSNILLTEALEGEIEFHHTAPFPSMKRPFVFHCEAFAPVFFPFTQQGDGKYRQHAALKAHYQSIFSNPMCLAIFSHIPETLESFRLFFNSPSIDEKLFSSKAGLSNKSFDKEVYPEFSEGNVPRFLFINSASQSPNNFFKRGGHIALRFWKEYLESGRRGQLILQCGRPSDLSLKENGVDPQFVASEMGKSILWTQKYLSNHELNALMQSSQFFLLPSASLHSASILHAMHCAAIPVVTDTLGTSVYVNDGETGIVLKGMHKAIWSRDSDTGIFLDNYKMAKSVDDSLVSQLLTRVCGLLDQPDTITPLRRRILSEAKTRFSGKAFSDHFWQSVQNITESTAIDVPTLKKRQFVFKNGTLDKADWARVFESVPQPVKRIYSGDDVIFELGGTFLHAHGNSEISLNDWSVLEHYLNPSAPKLKIEYDLLALVDMLFPSDKYGPEPDKPSIVKWVSRKLMRNPKLHGLVRRFFRYLKAIILLAIRFSKYWAGYKLGFGVKEDSELVAEGIEGFNIVRYFHLFIAIPVSEGEFDVYRLKNNEYMRIYKHFRYSKLITRIINDK